MMTKVAQLTKPWGEHAAGERVTTARWAPKLGLWVDPVRFAWLVDHEYARVEERWSAADAVPAGAAAHVEAGLIAAGLWSRADVAAAGDDTLLAIDGIGAKTLEAIRAVTAGDTSAPKRSARRRAAAADVDVADELGKAIAAGGDGVAPAPAAASEEGTT